MTYEEKYQELVELSHNEHSEIRKKVDNWLISIGLQGAAELKVSAFLPDLVIIWQTASGLQEVDGLKVSSYLLDTARQHIEGEISIDEARERITSRLPKSQFDTLNSDLL